MALILLVDDDDQFRVMLQAMLERLGHTVVTARSGKEALACNAERPSDLVITDLIMPDKDGLEVIRELHESAPNVPIIAMSGGGRMNPAMYLKIATQMGAREVLAKPFTLSQLSTAIESATAQR
jgi:CheY-like chemotaxis protein